MLLKLMNLLAGLFGYEWVQDTRPPPKEEYDDPIYDEDWEDLTEHSPRYRLRKKSS